MNLLLDTQIVLWAKMGGQAVPAEARVLMVDTANLLWFSVVTIWEVATKTARGKPDFEVDAARLRTTLLDDGYNELSIDGGHCLEYAAMPRLHGDPFDRMLVAQARAQGMALLTTDAKLGGYGDPVRVV